MPLLLLRVIAVGCALICFGVLASAQERTLGNVGSVEKKRNGVSVTLASRAVADISFFNRDTVRVRVAPSGKFEPDQSYAVVGTPDPSLKVEIKSDKKFSTLSAPGGARVTFSHEPFRLVILDSAGRVVLEEDGTRLSRFSRETGEIEASFRREPTEVYFGLGEKALPLSRHNHVVTMWNTDVYRYKVGQDPLYQAIPFFIGLKDGRAFGVFFDNTWRTFFDLGKTYEKRFTFGAPGGELNYYVFTGGDDRSPANILRDYSTLTGRAPMPPVWALGFHQSRFSYTPDAKVREVAEQFRKNRLPLDAIHFDIDYMDGFRVFTWDKKTFPEPAKLITDLRMQGIKAVVIVDPAVKVDEKYPLYSEGVAGGHFLEPRGRVWPGEAAFPDFTNPKTRAWFGAQYKGFLSDGVAGFWNDMNEPSSFIPDDTLKKEPATADHPERTLPLSTKHVGDGIAGDHARYHNVYGMQMARSSREGLLALNPNERPFVLTRAGYAGIQRYAAVWSGDNTASWDHLRLTIPLLTNLSVSGVPFIGADVGGFTGSPSAELFARWLQAGSLTPFFRAHSDRGFGPHEPYGFGDKFTEINRATIEFRYLLLPYLIACFEEHQATGAPVMRPLWYACPTDPQAILNDSQFLLGRDLLVAPVMEEGATKVGVYFPKGDTWIDWHSGSVYEGGTSAQVDAPLERLPVFVRLGATIPTLSPIQSTDEIPTAKKGSVKAVMKNGKAVLVAE